MTSTDDSLQGVQLQLGALQRALNVENIGHQAVRRLHDLDLALAAAILRYEREALHGSQLQPILIVAVAHTLANTCQ